MKLNPDCIRDILLVVEKETDLNTQVRYPVETVDDLISSYTQEEVLYHIKQCELSGMFAKIKWYNVTMGCVVFYLSPAGHEFLSNIKDDGNWSKTKEMAGKVGSFSLNVLKEIAVSVIASVLTKELGK